MKILLEHESMTWNNDNTESKLKCLHTNEIGRILLYFNVLCKWLRIKLPQRKLIQLQCEEGGLTGNNLFLNKRTVLSVTHPYIYTVKANSILYIESVQLPKYKYILKKYIYF